MGKEIRSASDMIQNFLGRQPDTVSVSTLRKALPISFTVLVMALDQLGREGKVSVERSRVPHSCRIFLKRQAISPGLLEFNHEGGKRNAD